MSDLARLRGRYKPWTNGQEKRLAELWQRLDLSIEEIGFAMERSQSAIQCRAKSLGLPNRCSMRRRLNDQKLTADADRTCGTGI